MAGGSGIGEREVPSKGEKERKIKSARFATGDTKRGHYSQSRTGKPMMANQDPQRTKGVEKLIK